MAMSTFGTNATSTLTAFQWTRQPVIADVAQVNANIKIPVSLRAFQGGFGFNGILFFPNRGFLTVRPGDWVGYGSTGFPFVVSSGAKTADWTSA